MTRLPITIIVTVFIALVIGINGDGKDISKRDVFQIIETDDVAQWLCDNYPAVGAFLNLCTNKTTTHMTSTTKSSTVAPGTTAVTDSSSSSSGSTTSSSSPSPLQSAHWCSFSNGSYIPLGFTFMNTACTLCQCTQSKAIRCTTLQCMKTYCIDNSTPYPKKGECCPQCNYEVNSTACRYDGISIPHGTLIKSSSTNIYCWCQMGNVECRKFGSTVMEGLDLWGQGTAVYVVIVIILVILIIGTTLCGACTLLYYYYYRSYQQSVQQASEQYWNNAGWQPMTEEDQGIDANAQAKQAEAEQNQFANENPTGYSEEYIPPPYALYNGAYVSTEEGKNQNHM